MPAGTGDKMNEKYDAENICTASYCGTLVMRSSKYLTDVTTVLKYFTRCIGGRNGGLIGCMSTCTSASFRNLSTIIKACTVWPPMIGRSGPISRTRIGLGCLLRESIELCVLPVRDPSLIAQQAVVNFRYTIDLSF